ncbi:LLM class flavin-dependent oxidoreductase, partial [Rhizobiaceae sp. 2RAB30]
QSAVLYYRDCADTKLGFMICAFSIFYYCEITSYIENARFQRRLSESLHQRRQQSSDGYLMAEQPSPNDLLLDTIRANIPVGSVNQVIDRLLEEISILKPNHIALQTQLGDFDQATMLRQIELWGDRIIPAINRELGTGAAPT